MHIGSWDRLERGGTIMGSGSDHLDGWLGRGFAIRTFSLKGGDQRRRLPSLPVLFSLPTGAEKRRGSIEGGEEGAWEGTYISRIAWHA